jgi:hypothetical protein
MRWTNSYPYPTFSKLDLAAGSTWTVVSTSDQSFDNGNWIGEFSQTANGDSTDMRIEIDWTAGASPLGVPITQPEKVGYSSFDTGIPFISSTGKARIFAIRMDFTDVTSIVNPTHRLNLGLYIGETALGDRVGTTAGTYYGGEVSDPFGTYNYNQFSQESITASNLINTSGDTVAATIEGVILTIVLSPDGQIITSEFRPIHTPSGFNITYSNLNKRKSSGFQTPSSGSTIKLGAWFGTAKTAQAAGSNYDFSYRLQYAYKELS